jgi:hypothetical protein
LVVAVPLYRFRRDLLDLCPAVGLIMRKWMLDDPRANFAISTRGEQAGLDHLGIQVETPDELHELYGAATGGSTGAGEGATTCCCRIGKVLDSDPQGYSIDLGPIRTKARACCAMPKIEAAPAAACCTPRREAAA